MLFDIRDNSICLPTFSPDGSRFASVVGDMVIRVWDSLGTFLRESPHHSGKIMSLVFSPDGTRIISICSNPPIMGKAVETTVQIWHLIEDSDLVTLGGCSNDIRSAAFLPDTDRFITLSYSSGTMQIWDMAQGTPALEATLSTSGHRDTMAISADGTRLLSFTPLHGIPLLFFDVVNQKELVSDFAASTQYIAAKFSPDGSRVAYANSDCVAILCATTGAFKLLHPPIENGRRIPTALSFSPDATRLLQMSTDGDVRILDITHLPTSVGVNISYPTDCMAVQDLEYNIKKSGGWYHGENGARLLWLPEGMRRVWLASGIQLGRCHLILGGDGGEVITLDMSDYVKVPPVGVAWRNGGIRYTSNRAEIVGAYALVGKS